MEEPRKLSLKDEIENEAKQIEIELAKHPELEELQVTEEMDTALWAKIRAYEQEKSVETEGESKTKIDATAMSDVPEEKIDATATPDVPEEKSAQPTVRSVRKYHARKRMRMWVALAAVLVLVMGLGVISMGSKSYWKVLFDKMLGKVPQKVTNVEDMDSIATEETTEVVAYQEIAETLKLDIVKFKYKPENMEFVSYNLDEKIGQAQIFYEYKDEVIRYSIYSNGKDSSFGKTEEDKKIGEEMIEKDGIKIKVSEYRVKNKENRLLAEFQHQGVQYELIGIMEKEEFKNILKNLYFF